MLNKLQSFLISQKSLILEANKLDVKSGNDKIDFDSIINCFNFTNETKLYASKIEAFKDNKIKTIKIYDSYGTILLDCENNLINPITKAIAMSIFTNNSLVISLKTPKNYITINMIVTLTNRFLNEINSNLKIEITDKNTIETITSYNINKVISIASKNHFLKYNDLYDVDTKFFSLEKPVIIVHDKANLEYLKDIKDITIYTNKKLDLDNKQIIVKNMDEAINSINKLNLHKVILLTNNEEIAIKFINFTKCENVLVNSIDLNQNMPNFDQEDFLYIKTYQTVL
jgi:hypothetical protein